MPAINRTGKPLLTVRGIQPLSPATPRSPRLPVLNAAQHLRVPARSTATKDLPSAPAAWRAQLEQGRQMPQVPPRLLPALPGGAGLLARRAELASARHRARLEQARQSATLTPRPPDCPKPLKARPVTVRPSPPDVLARYLSNTANRQRFECAAHSGALLHQDVSSDSTLTPKGFYGVFSSEAEPAFKSSNTFSPRQWILDVPKPNADIPAIDVVMTQFELAATEGNLQYCRPASLWFYTEYNKASATQLATSPLVTALTDLLQMDLGEMKEYLSSVELFLRPRENSQNDFLTRYLQNPEHAEFRRRIRDELNTARLSGNWGGEPGGSYCTSSESATRKPNQFFNLFSPTEWRMMSNYRYPGGAPYFASDAVLAQYDFISKKHGFYGQLPKRMVSHSIVNATTLAVMAEEGAGMHAFLTRTPNGKHKGYMLEALGMTACSLDWNPKEQLAALHTQPLADTDLGARPKNS